MNKLALATVAILSLSCTQKPAVPQKVEPPEANPPEPPSGNMKSSEPTISLGSSDTSEDCEVRETVHTTKKRKVAPVPVRIRHTLKGRRSMKPFDGIGGSRVVVLKRAEVVVSEEDLNFVKKVGLWGGPPGFSKSKTTLLAWNSSIPSGVGAASLSTDETINLAEFGDSEWELAWVARAKPPEEATMIWGRLTFWSWGCAP